MRAQFLSLTRQSMLHCVRHCLPLLLSVALRRPRLPRRPDWPPCANPSILSLVSKQMCLTTSAPAEMACTSHFARISWIFSPCTAGSCLFTDPCFSPILGVSNHFQTVFPSCGTESSELVFSFSAPTEKTISTGCFVCAGCAKAVRVAFSLSCCL